MYLYIMKEFAEVLHGLPSHGHFHACVAGRGADKVYEVSLLGYQ
jgi:hypothetical protein